MLLILHADHEQNCSTSTVRLVGSSHANLFASISAGISALWGPLHGGANQTVIEMLEHIAAEEGSAERFLQRAKDSNDTTRLMGFGHRVYKSYDPRAAILKKACDEVIERVGQVEPAARDRHGARGDRARDEYFMSRKLYPNVDFYSGVIYKAIGIPVNMFTVDVRARPACRAGSRNGWRCAATRSSRSAARARSTSARSSAATRCPRSATRRRPRATRDRSRGDPFAAKPRAIERGGANAMPVKPSESEEEYFKRIELERLRNDREEAKRRLADDEKTRLRELHWMRRPKCGLELSEVDYRGIFVDACFGCGGMFFDRGEVDKLHEHKEPGVLGRMVSTLFGTKS